MRPYLSVSRKGIRVSDLDKQNHTQIATTTDELSAALMPFADDDGVLPDGFMFSSSMNWPEEYTDDPKVLEAVEWVMTIPEETAT